MEETQQYSAVTGLAMPEWLSLDHLAAFIAACSAVFAAIQLMMSRRQMREEFAWRKRERVSKHSVFQNPEYRLARDRIDSVFGSFDTPRVPLPLETVLDAIDVEENLENQILTVLSHWGRLCSEIEHGLVDSQYAQDMHGHNLARVYAAFAHWIDHRSAKGRVSFPLLTKFGRKWAAESGIQLTQKKA